MVKCKVGLDIGSTTAKMVVLDADDKVIFDIYRRHQANVRECLTGFLNELGGRLGGERLSVCITGSVGMGMAGRLSLPFVQEVVAATNYLCANHPEVATMIDIGGEDAKMAFFNGGQPSDLRMNGNCAGGTGAFIDQMAILLNVSPVELGTLAAGAARVYPIASRCGVFCKTDIQNLIARNVPKEDIAASIFHAVSVQTVTTLAHGHDIKTPILLCGGPLAFIPALRKAFADYLRLPPESFVLPDKANLIPAWGAALSGSSKTLTVSDFIKMLETCFSKKEDKTPQYLDSIFKSRSEYDEWKLKMSGHSVERVGLTPSVARGFIGIDSGSTTTKIVVLDDKGRMLFHHYQDNDGNPVKAVEEGLGRLLSECKASGTALQVCGSCSTG